MKYNLFIDQRVIAKLIRDFNWQFLRKITICIIKIIKTNYNKLSLFMYKRMSISCKIKSKVLVLVKIFFIGDINYQNFTSNTRLKDLFAVKKI